MEKRSARKTGSDDIRHLTRRLAAGEEAAFREFHERYFDRLYRFLLVVTRGDEHGAQDALQQALLRVARHARAFDSEEVFWCWLKALARNAARDAGRKQRRYMALLQRFAIRTPIADAREAFGEEQRLREVLENCLGELGPEDRELIESKYAEGVTVKELSAQSGESEKAVESRLLRLRRALRERVLKRLQTL